MEPENGPPGKGDPFWKPSFSGSMLNFRGVFNFIIHQFTNVPTVSSNDGSPPATGAAAKLGSTLGALGYGGGRYGGRIWHLEKSLNELRGLDHWGLNLLVL